MNNRDKIYPDISDILALKREGRRQIARHPFGMKIAMVEAMRERLAPLKRLRELRKSEIVKRNYEMQNDQN
jgi:hypothetical protein